MLRTAMEQGMVNCNASMNSVLDETRAHLVDPLDTVFYDPFKNISGRVEVFKNVNRTLFNVNLFMQLEKLMNRNIWEQKLWPPYSFLSSQDFKV